MSIYTALRAGVSGLSANASAMAVISDNISNINTVSFKRGVTDFTALLNAQTQNSFYNAGGVFSSTRRLVDVQGSLEQSRSTTDLAIAGAGFFVVGENDNPLTSGGSVAFTRAGSFTTDSEGYLKNAQGFYLQGWPVQANGSVLSSPTSLATLEPINVANVVTTAEPTSQVTLSANLDSSSATYGGTPVYAVGALATSPTSGITPTYETTVEVYDSLGAPHSLAIGFLKTAASTWQIEVYTRPASLAPANPGGRVASGTVRFDGTGNIDTANSTLPSTLNIAWAGSTGANPQAVTLNLNPTLTQFANASGVSSVVADGVPPGSLKGLTVEKDGYLTAQFSNGRSRALYQIPVATFLNSNALLADRGGVFRGTLESGQFNLNASNAGGAGRIESSVLEASNVDLAQEFTTMITTQRAYSASSKIITTADQMLEELLSIRR